MRGAVCAVAVRPSRFLGWYGAFTGYNSQLTTRGSLRSSCYIGKVRFLVASCILLSSSSLAREDCAMIIISRATPAVVVPAGATRVVHEVIAAPHVAPAFSRQLTVAAGHVARRHDGGPSEDVPATPK